jgi:hypothetical protein
MLTSEARESKSARWSRSGNSRRSRDRRDRRDSRDRREREIYDFRPETHCAKNLGEKGPRSGVHRRPIWPD